MLPPPPAYSSSSPLFSKPKKLALVQQIRSFSCTPTRVCPSPLQHVFSQRTRMPLPRGDRVSGKALSSCACAAFSLSQAPRVCSPARGAFPLFEQKFVPPSFGFPYPPFPASTPFFFFFFLGFFFLFFHAPLRDCPPHLRWERPPFSNSSQAAVFFSLPRTFLSLSMSFPHDQSASFPHWIPPSQIGPPPFRLRRPPPRTPLHEHEGRFLKTPYLFPFQRPQFSSFPRRFFFPSGKDPRNHRGFPFLVKSCPQQLPPAPCFPRAAKAFLRTSPPPAINVLSFCPKNYPFPVKRFFSNLLSYSYVVVSYLQNGLPNSRGLRTLIVRFGFFLLKRLILFALFAWSRFFLQPWTAQLFFLFFSAGPA